MANPTLTKTSEKQLTIDDNAKKLFQAIYIDQNDDGADSDNISKIKVSELISKMAFYYEKIRNTVDYEEENLLQKNAIERILKRQIVIEGTVKEWKGEEIAKHLLTELIRAGYLPNNKIPETKIEEIGQVIDKYLKLRKYGLQYLEPSPRKKFEIDIKFTNELTSWILAIAASDIEERLGRSRTSQTVVDNMYKILKANIDLPDNSPFKGDRDIQIYVGIHRNYLRFDREMLSYILLKYYISSWDKASDEKIKEVAKDITELRQAIDNQLDHPLIRQINRIIKRYTVCFRILTEVIEENPTSVYDGLKKDPKAFPRSIKRICNKEYKIAKAKLWRAAVRSIFYIFITKSIFVFLLEIPAIKWFGEDLNPVSLAINVSFPALLLFVVVLFAKLPTDQNTMKIIDGINEIVYIENRRKEPYKLKSAIARGKGKDVAFGVMYAITFFISFGFVIWALNKINFNIISITIFLFFLAFVSFFSIRIRKGTRELIIEERKESILNLFVDFFYTPVIASGKYLSEKFSRLNVFVFVLDFIIEAPFKIFVEIAEDWSKYVKERREEIG